MTTMSGFIEPCGSARRYYSGLSVAILLKPGGVSYMILSTTGTGDGLAASNPFSSNLATLTMVGGFQTYIISLMSTVGTCPTRFQTSKGFNSNDSHRSPLHVPSKTFSCDS